MHQYAKHACMVIESYFASGFLLYTTPYIMISYEGSLILQGRMILAHLCDEPKGLKTGMCMV